MKYRPQCLGRVYLVAYKREREKKKELNYTRNAKSSSLPDRSLLIAGDDVTLFEPDKRKSVTNL